MPYFHCCLFFYFCAVSGPVLHPCQLSTRFWIFLKPPFLLHQSVFCLHKTGESAYRDFACVQTSPISFVARGKGPFSACNKGNRRRLHAGKPRLHLKLLSRPGGRGALPMMAYTRRLRPKGVSFSGFRYKRVGISLVEVYKWVGKSVVWV